MSALKYWVWLAECRGVSNQARLALLRHFGSPEDGFYADAGDILLTEGITREQANALALDFGAGMGCGSVCGAVTGALMAMGGLGLPQEQRLELLRRFRNENGSLDCAALLKAAAERGEPKKSHCDRMVAQCVDYLCEATGKE